ncbi:TonB-dependent siderophore receptor [Alcaligenaceae bacterium SJ-26]|nr:TonB-dependent siderophore receptor [Alcaligenaceae bacterium SJ-26]
MTHFAIRGFKLNRLAAALCCLSLAPQVFAQSVQQLDSVDVLGTAEQELKQAPGVSIITAEDISRQPPRNDIADILRTQPGVNLTGNSTSGQRGNNRQIDIRGMGPENTMILIDGKPVSSRQSVRYGWRGERDSRGDTNWVPVNEIERIEVLRGPAAARYGSGAAGGVVNIVTKGIGDTLGGTANVYLNEPQHSDEGSSRRFSFGLNGPINDKLGFRLYGNVTRTGADDYEINKNHASQPRNGDNWAAGREGVRNRDINGLLRLTPADGHEIDLEAGYGRQGNIYTGDAQNTNGQGNNEVKKHIGDETNRIYRRSVSLTHRGRYNEDTSSLSYVSLEKTRNTRLLEGLAGGSEGAFNDPTRVRDGGVGDVDLRTLTLHSEMSHQFELGGIRQVGTLGVEYVDSKLEDNASDLSKRNIPGAHPSNPTLYPVAYQPVNKSRIFSVFAETNIYATDDLTLTPGLRFDHHNQSGSNWSPSLNASYLLADGWSIKAGIARAYKAPNLYQNNDGYLLYSAGQGCYGATAASGQGCFLVGNSDLKPETSVNKELGIEYANDGFVAGLTYFRNDYRNKIEAGREAVSASLDPRAGSGVFQWENVPKAVVEGLEGNLRLPLSSAVLWNTNFTYMLQSKNKTSGERLSTIPEYTINTALEWQVDPQWSVRANATFYGEQKPPKYDFLGNPATGSARDTVSPYALVGLSTQYVVNRNFNVTLGVDNLFDKRLFRRGNAVTVSQPGTGVVNIAGAGAYTYNEPGRTFFINLATSF